MSKSTWVLVGTAVGVSGVVAASIVAVTGGFSYAIDDPYIHLRLSELLAQGTYGINPGEAAAPSSSIVWPLLLAPFASLSIHPYVPLALGVIALALTLLLAHLALRLTWDRAHPWMVTAMAVALGVLLNWYGLPFLGMEHGLQVLATVACAAGLIMFISAGAPPWWFWAGAIAGPLIRYENLVVTIAVLILAGLWGHWRAALASAAAAAIPVAAFSVLLVSLGLPPVPASILTKTGSSLVKLQVPQLLSLDNHVLVLGLLPPLALSILLLARRSLINDWDRWLGLLVAAGTVAVAHLLVGSQLWYLGRYQAYLLAFTSVSVLAVLPVVHPRLAWSLGPVIVTLAMTVLVVTSSFRLIRTAIAIIPAAQNIYDQQYQLHRLAVDDLRAPIAVNDIGWISYRNPYRVIDLWGLGSEPARQARRVGGPGWAAALVDPDEVPAAAVFTDWFGGLLPTSWVRVGQVSVPRQVSVGETTVDVYATSEANVPRVREALRSYAEHPGPRTTVTLEPAT